MLALTVLRILGNRTFIVFGNSTNDPRNSIKLPTYDVGTNEEE
jgi:hypothetical protein